MRSINLLISSGVVAFLMSSCAYINPYYSALPAQVPDVQATQPTDPTVSSAEQKTVRKAREKVSRSASSSGSSSSGGSSSTPKPSTGTPEVKKTDYRYALEIPGKDGFVFNPYTNNPVDVRGIPSGTLVRDPQDSNPDHKFRVP
ncbi:MAG: hypothetical protein HKN82_11155 [Akkermansiaceae bacterium]|nr:hypothetical protein [Akkermansiaceae bacterium]NNM29598.1 hypothetical protein [Akkermansiaceae bacterium]